MKQSRHNMNNTIKTRAYALSLLLLLLACVAVRSLVNASNDTEYVAAAGRQSLYRLDIAKTRGTIYDCNLRPLTGGASRWVAAIAPTIESVGVVETATNGRYRQRLALALENGKPFTLTLDQPVGNTCVDMFMVTNRYSEKQLAPHVVGYLDGQGRGAAGVELAMDDALDRSSGELTVYYQVDALGRAIAGAERVVQDSRGHAAGGVAVTIDSEIQRLAEQAASGLGRGAVVVTEVPGCQIRALVSLPDFQPNHLNEAAGSKDSPLVNRAFSAFAPGSVFKLVTAAVELENGTALSDFTCTGAVNAGGLLFHCYDGQAHGEAGLPEAIAKSCNGYFISAARALGGQPVLTMAYNLGLGAKQEFGRGLFSAAGNLPSADSLLNVRALANFALGQGDVTVTPVQLCGMMNAIASGGVYRSPKLIEGLVDAQGTLTPQSPVTDLEEEAMSAATAKKLREYLEGAAETGTGWPGAPDGIVCGIKTGTAQTGLFQNGKELSHFWYCGFICDENGPRYCITVLKETAADSAGTARAFKEIGEGIAGLKF